MRAEQNEIAGDENKGYRTQITGRAVRTLGSLGQASKPYLGDIEEVFRDATASDSSRSTAVGAMIQIDGLEEALDHFNELDPVGVKVLIGNLAGYGGRTDGTFNTDPTHRRRIRELIVIATRNEDVATRTGALEALIPAFGTEVVIIRSPEDYEWNPMFIGALDNIAANDPDPALRQRAARGRDQLDLDRAVQRILRRRGEEKENRDETPRTP